MRQRLQSPLLGILQCCRTKVALQQAQIQRRSIQITSVPTSQDSTLNLDSTTNSTRATEGPDAQFEILGQNASLLSATISASQPLYTRRGTLAGFSGNAEHTTSKLSILEPIRRTAGGIPFLYQKVVSTSPISVLISAKTAFTSYSIVQLDGRLDWMVAQRNALLAWTGHTLSLRPHVNTSMGSAHWGRTNVTGRGLLCLSGKGNMYQINIKTGEEYIVHPSHVVAYAIMRHAPQPYRFKSTTLRLQIPGLSSIFPNSRFVRTMRETSTWKFLASTFHAMRTWFRRSVLGDRLFLRFQGPANILLQSRGNRLADSLTNRDVNEIADAPAGSVEAAVAGSDRTNLSKETAAKPIPASVMAPTRMSYAKVARDGHVEFDSKR